MKLIVLVFLTINLLFAENIEYSESKNGLTHPFFGYKKQIIKEENKDEVKNAENLVKKIKVQETMGHSPNSPEVKNLLEHINVLTELSLRVQILLMVKEMKAFVPEFKSQNSQFEELD